MKAKTTLPHIRRYFLYYSFAILCVTLATLACGRQQPCPTTASNSSGQNSSSKNKTPTPDPQAIERLKKFSHEDLLKEIRARELETDMTDLSNPLLERRTEEKFYQPKLITPKRNPLLAGYVTENLVTALRYQQSVVYGADNRKEIFEITDSQLQKSADAVVGLFRLDRIAPLADGINSRIVGNVFGTEYRLCSTERFLSQPCSSFCSGVLVASDIIATAGHCVDELSTGTPPPTGIKFVFGYRMSNASTPNLIIRNSEIYTGKETVARTFNNTGADWALVRLDRPVVGHQPVAIRRSQKISDGQDLYIIGHPCGLPAKYADDAKVRNNSNSDFFVANLDSYAGNSGSPVFNRATHEVEGLLVRGQTDFVTQDPDIEESCQVSLVCPTTGCRGEDSVRTTLFAYLVP